VLDEFGGTVPVIDGGDSVVGIESTIIDLSRGFPALLRPGHVTPEAIAAVLGRMPVLPGEHAPARSARVTSGIDLAQPVGNALTDAPRASGTLRAHYAPTTPLALMSLDAIGQMLHSRAPGVRYAVVVRTADGDLPASLAHSVEDSVAGAADKTAAHADDANAIEWVHAPADPEGYARVLYGMLRALDAANVDRILVEALPQDSAWQAVADRLGRAAAAFDPGAD
jgi:L-threonylcarbamoyladenylate synthase